MKLKHPDSKLVVETTEEQAPMYESQGWQSQAKKGTSSDG